MITLEQAEQLSDETLKAEISRAQHEMHDCEERKTRVGRNYRTLLAELKHRRYAVRLKRLLDEIEQLKAALAEAERKCEIEE